MSDQQDSEASGRLEDEQDRDGGHTREDDRDEAIRDGIARDNELKHAIDEDDA